MGQRADSSSKGTMNLVSEASPSSIRLDAAITARLDALAATPGRVVLGITGAPGSGKSTLASAIVAHLLEQDCAAARAPMDGYHLADVQLDRLGLRRRKGAIETFDGDGYVHALLRLRQRSARPVYLPGFDRTLEQPIAAAIAVLPEHRFVVTEGNYLLDADAPWAGARELLDEVWFCDLTADERQRRLVTRHVHFGKTPDEAEAWVAAVDEDNARRILATRPQAHRVVRTDGDAWSFAA